MNQPMPGTGQPGHAAVGAVTGAVDADPIDLYLWSRGGTVHAWGPRAMADLGPGDPGRDACPTTLTGLRKRLEPWSLTAALRPPLAELLADQLAVGGALRLHLDAGLPETWQRFPFEWLHHRGAPLHGRLSVIRDWQHHADAAVHLDPAARVLLFDLLGSDEVPRHWDALAGGLADIHGGAAVVQHIFAVADPTTWAALAVVAHGSQDAGAAPFLIPGDIPWSLPVERGVPPLVLLAACGDDRGNLIDEARRILEAGAQTVIAPLGALTLDGALHLLAEVVTAWRGGARIDDALRQAAACREAPGGAWRMLLFGRGDLRLAMIPGIETLDDRLLARAGLDGDTRALAVLLERLTRRTVMAGRPIDEAEKPLYDLCTQGPHDEAGERALLAALASVEGSLPPTVRAWMLPFLAELAETHDHRLMASLEQGRNLVEAAGLPLTSAMLHAWSRIDYRRGRYARALSGVIEGLRLIDHPRERARAVDLVLHLIGLLVALDLPEPAHALADWLADDLTRLSGDGAADPEFLLREVRGRIALRAGQPRIALMQFRLKHQEASRLDEDGQRELATLHHLTAWLEPDEPDDPDDWAAWSRAVAECLEETPSARRDGRGAGNCERLYLLRARAAWGWRRGDPAALAQVLAERDTLRACLLGGRHADAGPAGMALAYLTLAERDGLLCDPPIPTWEEIATALEGQHYHLELAALARLLGYRDQSERWLARFRAQRALPEGPEPPEWLTGATLAGWRVDGQVRETHERRVLLDPAAVTPARLLESGLLPL